MIANVRSVPGYVNNAASNASNAPAAIECGRYNELWINVRMPETGDPVGTITVTGSLNGTDFAPLPMADGAIGGLVSSTITWASTAPGTITVNDPVAALSVLFGFDSPPPWVKVAWTRTGGGHTSGLYIDYFLRSV